MKKIMNRLQKDLQKLQKVIAKESSALVKKAKSSELKENIEVTRKELGKIVKNRLSTLEPAYMNCLGQIQKSLAKAGIHVDQLDETLGTKVKKSKKVVKKKASAKKNTSTKKKTSTKKVATKKKTKKKKS